MEETRKRGGARGRGRGKRGARGGRGRGRKERSHSSDEENLLNISEEISDSKVENRVNVYGNSATVAEISNEDSNANSAIPIKEIDVQAIPPPLGMEDDISQLEAPTFTTLVRAPPEPMLRLKWNHKVNLIGEKVLNPMIYNCDTCDKPILVYGRMIPCKHVFCLKCARSETQIKICPRCKDKVIRVEQSSLGTVFMCMHGGSRYGNTGCRRTYLSQRDLQAHINHRHVTQQPDPIKPPPAAVDQKQRKISESSTSMPVLNTQRSQIAPLTTSNLTRANLATLNEQQQKGSHIHSTHAHESVADASYYSNALSNYGSHSNAQSFTGSNNQHFNQPPISNVPQPPPPQFYPPIGQPQNFPGQTTAPNFHGTNSSSQWNNPQHQQYYR